MAISLKIKSNDLKNNESYLSIIYALFKEMLPVEAKKALVAMATFSAISGDSVKDMLQAQKVRPYINAVMILSSFKKKAEDGEDFSCVIEGEGMSMFIYIEKD